MVAVIPGIHTEAVNSSSASDANRGKVNIFLPMLVVR